jgi:hypothetical protein
MLQWRRHITSAATLTIQEFGAPWFPGPRAVAPPAPPRAGPGWNWLACKYGLVREHIYNPDGWGLFCFSFIHQLAWRMHVSR